jgi:hypothetical protein
VNPYEKTLCYIKIKSTYYQAQKLCAKLGMQLYEIESSPKALAEAVEMGDTTLGLSAEAVVFVAGRRGNKCHTLNGKGISKYDWCSTTYNFVCEFRDKSKFEMRFNFGFVVV